MNTSTLFQRGPFNRKRICQWCSRWYYGTTNTRYCSSDCRDIAASERAKIRQRWNRTQQPLTMEQRRKELDNILGTDEV